MNNNDEKIFLEAEVYLDNKNYLQAYCLFDNLSKKGHCKAQNVLAYMYLNGQGVSVSLSNANNLWKQSALGGNPDSQFQVSFSLFDEKKTEEGIEWLKKASLQKHTNACYLLGLKYYHGIDVIKDRQEAIRLFEIASKQGLSKASRALVQSIHKEYGTFQALKKLIYILFKRKLDLN